MGCGTVWGEEYLINPNTLQLVTWNATDIYGRGAVFHITVIKEISAYILPYVCVNFHSAESFKPV